MSSLAASRADGFYFPPEWRPEMGGISKFQGSKGANQYQQYGIIRFELPFDGWCTKCESQLGKGLRFNAKKDNIGKYFSTTLYSFNMKCPFCSHVILIKTDPKNRTYDYAEGIRKMEHEYTPEEGDSLLEVMSDSEKQLLRTDPLYKLQHEQEDMLRAKTAAERIVALSDLSEKTRKKDYDVNSVLRKKNREKRAERQALKAEGEKKGLSIPLLQYNEQDSEIAKSVRFKQRGNFSSNEKLRLNLLRTESIFSSSSSTNDNVKLSGFNSGRKSSSHSEHLKNLVTKSAIHRIHVNNFTVKGSQQTVQTVPTVKIIRKNSKRSANEAGIENKLSSSSSKK